jgi:hypothetical protein
LKRSKEESLYHLEQAERLQGATFVEHFTVVPPKPLTERLRIFNPLEWEKLHQESELRRKTFNKEYKMHRDNRARLVSLAESVNELYTPEPSKPSLWDRLFKRQ